MLTGALAPTAGDCVIGGYYVNHQIDAIRQIIGVCPQVRARAPRTATHVRARVRVRVSLCGCVESGVRVCVRYGRKPVAVRRGARAF